MGEKLYPVAIAGISLIASEVEQMLTKYLFVSFCGIFVNHVCSQTWSFEPLFYPDGLMFVGLVFRKTGTAYIRKVLQHNTSEGFLSSIIAEVINPFGIEEENESSCLSSSLSINQAGNASYKLTLQSQSKCNNVAHLWGLGQNEELSFGKIVPAHL